MSKLLAQYELFKRVVDLSGDIVECGVFKGASFVRLAMFRNLLCHNAGKQLIGFDTFGTFPGTDYEPDRPYLKSFTAAAGDQSISIEQLRKVLHQNSCGMDVNLVKGDICKTVPQFCQDNPALKISLLNLDTDIYEPATTILHYLYPRIVPGGVLMLDDYGVFPGETQAVNEYFKDADIEIQSFPFGEVPSFIVKPEG